MLNYDIQHSAHLEASYVDTQTEMNELTRAVGMIGLKSWGSCRFGCGLHFNIQQAESQHAIYHCTLNPNKKQAKKRATRKDMCPRCHKLRTRLKLHLQHCKAGQLRG